MMEFRNSGEPQNRDVFFNIRIESVENENNEPIFVLMASYGTIQENSTNEEEPWKQLDPKIGGVTFDKIQEQLKMHLMLRDKYGYIPVNQAAQNQADAIGWTNWREKLEKNENNS